MSRRFQMFDAENDLNLEESVSAGNVSIMARWEGVGACEAKMKAPVDVLKGRAVKSSNECTWTRFQSWVSC